MSAFHKSALRAGSSIGEYRIESVLGHGGFGITYLAYDTTLNAQVAIKEFLPHQIAVRDENTGHVLPKPSREAVRDYHWGLKNFVKEARALAQFKHPNIVRVLRFMEANGTAFMVMEYEKGESLAQHLKKIGARPDEASLLKIFIPTLNGLHAVHEAQMLHLDIKPENIYLRADGSPMLIDFGSARQAFAGPGHVQRIALTHGYAPLEQYPDKGKQGPWTDIYAIGASMYRCVTGKQPDDSLERYQAFLKYKVDPLTPATKLAKRNYQPVLLDCIDWAMQIYPNDRPQTARALQDALIGKGRQGKKTAVASGPASFRSSEDNENLGAARSHATRSRRSSRARPIGNFIAILAVFAAVAGAYVWLPSDWYRVSTVRREAPKVVPADEYRAPVARNVEISKDARGKKTTSPAARSEQTERSSPPTLEYLTVAGHTDWVTSIAVSPTSHWFVSGSSDKTLRVWELPEGKLLGTLRGHGYAINAVDVSSDGQWIASAGNDGSVRLWEVSTGRQRGALKGHEESALFALAFSPDAKRVAAGGKDRIVHVWDVESGKKLHALEGHSGEINTLVFSPDGKWLASAGADRVIRVWQAHNGIEVTSLAGHRDAILTLAMSGNGRWLASGDNGRTVRVWNATDFSHARTFSEGLSPVISLAFDDNGQWLAVGDASKSVKIIDISAGRVAHQLEGSGDFVHATAFSPDGRWLVTGGRDQRVRVWGRKP